MAKYHFIAIGGIGMSGLAKYLLENGHEVSGSDICDSKYIIKLKELGAKVSIGHLSENVPKGATVIVSTAIRENNPELVRAKELGLKIYHRSDLLAEIASSAQKEGKAFIGFAGTHGKTTTSGLASFVLEKASLEPSFVDGGILPEINTNAQCKCGKEFVAELDESDGTLVKYNPDILVINNLEPDHLDFYKNGMEDLIKVFNQAISQAKKVIVNNDNEGIKELSGEFITFGLNSADYVAKNINNSREYTSFDIYYKNNLLLSLNIQLSGIHNVYNTLAVVSALNEAGVDLEKIKSYFANFTGMGRRFQKVCEVNEISIYDDYAHHPTEIKATIDAAEQKFGLENVLFVFQPHRYTRLQSLWLDFKSVLSSVNNVIVTDVYAASEDEIEGITGENFASELNNAKYISGDMQNVARNIVSSLKKGDVVIGLGAGTITQLGKYLKQDLENILNV